MPEDDEQGEQEGLKFGEIQKVSCCVCGSFHLKFLSLQIVEFEDKGTCYSLDFLCENLPCGATTNLLLTLDAGTYQINFGDSGVKDKPKS